MNKQCMKADMHHWLTILDDLRNSTSDLKRNTLSKFLWNQACLKIEILKHFFSCFFCTHKTNTGVLIFCCHVAEYHKVSSLKQYPLICSQSYMWHGWILSQDLTRLKSRCWWGSSHCGSAETNLTSIHKDACLIPGLTQWVKDLTLLWLWLAAAAPIRSLA